MKKSFLSGIAIILVLAVMMMPNPSFAGNTSSGSASIDWSSLSFTITGPTGAPVAPDWTANGLYGPGAETRWSFSGTGTGINEPADPYDSTDANDGGTPPWTNTYATATRSLGVNSVTGSADTHSSLTPYDPATAVPANRIFASSNLALSSIQTTGDIFAQAVLGGDFTVSTNALLQISVPYSLFLQLASNGSGFNKANVLAGLALYDFNTTDPITGQSLLLTQDEQSLSRLITGNGSIGPLAQNGTLSLSWSLLPSVVYDFEAYATAKANASVPEPMSLLLLLSGIGSLAFFRKRFA